MELEPLPPFLTALFAWPFLDGLCQFLTKHELKALLLTCKKSRRVVQRRIEKEAHKTIMKFVPDPKRFCELLRSTRALVECDLPGQILHGRDVDSPYAHFYNGDQLMIYVEGEDAKNRALVLKEFFVRETGRRCRSSKGLSDVSFPDSISAEIADFARTI